jgi:hypothetical protein
MSANVQKYALATVVVNGSTLTEESNVTVKRESGGNAVKTVSKGYAGRSPGAPMTMITVKNAVPSADFELDPGPFINQTEAVEISIFAAGRTMTLTGFIISDNFQHGVDSAAELEFEFEGGPGEWV